MILRIVGRSFFTQVDVSCFMIVYRSLNKERSDSRRRQEVCALRY
jgi:hypothetical protein